jgi:cell pole-organizing protein PopZ
MEEALAAIRRAITDKEASAMTLAPPSREPPARKLAQPEAGITVSRNNRRNRLGLQHLDRNCEEARADLGGCGSRNASPHAESWLEGNLPRVVERMVEAEIERGYSRTLITIPVELASVS